MKRNTTQKIRLGILVVVGLGLFTALVWLLGAKENMFSRTLTVYTEFRDVQGLQEGNNVRFSGINVGTVKEIALSNDSTVRVKMIIQTDAREFIKQDAVCTIGSDGLMGNKLINITRADHGDGEKINEGDVLASDEGISLNDLLATLKTTNDNARELSDELLGITKGIREGKGLVGTLLTDTTLFGELNAAIAELQLAGHGAAQTAAGLREAIDKLNSGQGLAGALISDSTMAQDLSQAIANLSEAGNEAVAVTRELNQLLNNVDEGKGAAGALLGDESVRQDLTQTMNNLREGTDNFNQNMEALKHNFLLRGYFKKQAKKAAKEQDREGK